MRLPEDVDEWLAARAEELRGPLTMTPAERILWDQLKPLGFRAQVPYIAKTKNGGRYPYVLDFLSKDGRLAVEVDGGIHMRRRGRDRRRDTRLATEGVATIRFKNSEVLKNPQAVVEKILTHVG